MSRTPQAIRGRALRRRDGGRVGRIAAWAAFGLVVVLVGLTVAGRLLSAPPSIVAAGVTFLPYLYAVVTAVVFCVWAAFPDRRAFPAVLFSVVAIAAAIWGPRWGTDGPVGPEVTGEELRVMSWNLRRLWGGPDDRGDASACAVDAIREAAPDVLTLLEVSKNDVDGLTAALDLTCVHHPYREGGGPKTGGLATCVRGGRWQLRSGAGQRFVDAEDWFYVFSELAHGDRVFNLLAVHLSPYEYVAKKLRTAANDLAQGTPDTLVDLSRQSEQIVRGQSDQSAALLERVDKFRDPTIVAGDFNSTRDSALHASLRQHLADAWDVGGVGFGGTVDLFEHLPLRIDYIYLSDQFRIRSTAVPQVGCSDHRPVVSDVVLTGGAP